MKRILKSFIFGLAVFFILTSILTIVHGAEVREGCCFGMVVDNTGTVSMRLQCGKDKPVDLGQCEQWEAELEHGQVGMATTCCSKEAGLCMTVITSTNKTRL